MSKNPDVFRGYGNGTLGKNELIPSARRRQWPVDSFTSLVQHLPNAYSKLYQTSKMER